MRKLAAGVIIGVLFGTGATVALASSGTHGSGALKPGGVKLQTSFGWTGLSRARAPVITRFYLLVPEGLRLQRRPLAPKCTPQTANRGGPAACPKGSIMGKGSGIAYAAKTRTRPKITIINGGAHEVLFFIVMNNPARVRQAVVGHLTKLSGRFVYHLSVVIPKDLRIVAGVPIKLTSLKIEAGRGRWLAITSAPAGIEIGTSYSTGFKTTSLLWIRNP